MGVLNVTPDSFSENGKYQNHDDAIAHALRMVDEGADILDVGGESSRPYACPVCLEEECRRVIPVIQVLSKLTSVPISIDTYKPEVMRRAVEAGASIINDIKALREPGALEAARHCNVPVVLMHMKGEPQTMQNQPEYENILEEINLFFKERIEQCLQAGIKYENLILDPGFGFGKTMAHNFQLLKQLNNFKKTWKMPLLVGLSRKSLIKKALGLDVQDSLYPSVALAIYAVLQGVNIIRAHDVLATRQALDMIEALEMNVV